MSSTAGAKPKPGPMDPNHSMDMASLSLGHPAVSKRTVTLVDLDVSVYGLDEIAGSDLPIAVITIAHGWAQNAKGLEAAATGLLGEIRRLEGGRKRTRDVIVATLDARNHGQRYRDKGSANYDTNPQRLIIMATTVTGGIQDHELLMDFLEPNLFPNGERSIVEYMSAGISMGGHVTWRLLRNNPRIRIGVPIITLPAESMGPNLLLTGKLFRASVYPPALKKFYELPQGDYRGKKILSLHGAQDALIPFKRAKDGLERIVAGTHKGDVEVFVQEDRGHVFSPEMMSRAAEWFWRWGVAV